HGQSAPEICFTAMLVSKALLQRAIRGQEKVPLYERAMSAVTLAASVATIRRLPHEFAESLLNAADAVRSAFAAPDLSEALHRRGADVDECLTLAAECALRAADLYAALDAPRRHGEALLVAARCLAGGTSPEIVASGWKWWSLARNQRALPWTAPRPG